MGYMEINGKIKRNNMLKMPRSWSHSFSSTWSCSWSCSFSRKAKETMGMTVCSVRLSMAQATPHTLQAWRCHGLILEVALWAHLHVRTQVRMLSISLCLRSNLSWGAMCKSHLAFCIYVVAFAFSSVVQRLVMLWILHLVQPFRATILRWLRV